MSEAISILCDLIYEGKPSGHGGHHRSAQLRELVASAGYLPEFVERKAQISSCAKYCLGIACLVGYRLRPPPSFQWLGRFGGNYHRYRTALLKYRGAKVLLWENTRPHNYIAARLVRSAGFRVVAAPQNLESFYANRRLPEPHRFPCRRLVAEARVLAGSDAVFSIGREEQWLLAWCGLPDVAFLPYYPPRFVLERLLEVRRRRERSSPGNRYLVLGSASNPSTRWGAVILLEWIRKMDRDSKIAFDVVGVGTDLLQSTFGTPAIKFHGWVGMEQLDTLLAGARALVVHQVAGVGALTRIREALIAGVPVIANPIAGRSATELEGVHVYSNPIELSELLRGPLPVPPVLGPPLQANTRFSECLRACAQGRLDADASVGAKRATGSRPSV